MKALRLIVLGLVAGLSACAAGPSYRTPQSDAPPNFAAQATVNSADTSAQSTAPPLELATWWRALNDEELNSLVERAVKSNLDLEIALDRLQQARTYEAVVIGYALPEVATSAAAGRGTGSDLTRGRADPALRSADNGAGLQHINTIAGFDAVWELDLFGKFRREFEAARADTQAARAARYDVLTSVVADVVRAYVELRGFQVRAGILHKASDVLRELPTPTRHHRRVSTGAEQLYAVMNDPMCERRHRAAAMGRVDGLLATVRRGTKRGSIESI